MSLTVPLAVIRGSNPMGAYSVSSSPGVLFSLLVAPPLHPEILSGESPPRKGVSDIIDGLLESSTAVVYEIGNPVSDHKVGELVVSAMRLWRAVLDWCGELECAHPADQYGYESDMVSEYRTLVAYGVANTCSLLRQHPGVRVEEAWEFIQNSVNQAGV
jgi:hypothetical protein